jgi:hypothetical protein
MKHFNLKHSILMLVFLGLLSACSTESIVVKDVHATDVKSSECKTSLSTNNTHTDNYQTLTNNPTVLHLQMTADNTVNAQFVDVLDNCMISQFHVEAISEGNKIVVILYPHEDMATDCVCQYDVNFKLKSLLAGSYQLEVYHTTANKKTLESYRIYQGTVAFAPNKSITLTMKRR